MMLMLSFSYWGRVTLGHSTHAVCLFLTRPLFSGTGLRLEMGTGLGLSPEPSLILYDLSLVVIAYGWDPHAFFCRNYRAV